MNSQTVPLEPVAWGEVKGTPEAESVAERSPLLYAAFDRLLGKYGAGEPVLWRARYTYGEFIVEKGSFVLPQSCDPQTAHLFGTTFWGTGGNAAGASPKHPCPFALVLSNSVEVSMPQNSASLGIPNVETWPLQIIRAGDVFGVFEFLDRCTLVPPAPTDGYSISAGARSIQIATTNQYYLALQKAAQLTENPSLPHFQFVREYARACKLEWACAVLLFPSWLMDVFAGDRSSPNIAELLFKRGWIQATHTRRSALHQDERARSIVNHLSNLSTGYLPAFVDARSCGDISGPFNSLTPKLAPMIERTRPVKHEILILQPWQLTRGMRGIYSFVRPQPYLGGRNSTPELASQDLPGVMLDLIDGGEGTYCAHVCKAHKLRQKVAKEVRDRLEHTCSADEAEKKLKRFCRGGVTLDDLSPEKEAGGTAPAKAPDPPPALCQAEGVFSTCVRVTGRHTQVSPFCSGPSEERRRAQHAS